jgi:hypothetical protein
MGYKTDQQHLVHRGRAFHFVSYEGLIANPKKEQEATPDTWFLMCAGKRWAVMPQVAEQARSELDAQLGRWLDENIFSGKSDQQSSRDQKDTRRHGAAARGVGVLRTVQSL